ncbi:hypothetical protein Hanom_Chr03g00212611 [Helianthus anomalus]
MHHIYALQHHVNIFYLFMSQQPQHVLILHSHFVHLNVSNHYHQLQNSSVLIHHQWHCHSF